jgi:hypothetical protein
MSFYKCGGNFGFDCNIPIPTWVDEVAKQKRFYYED